jgi:lactoylglutathione lyase
MAQNIAIERVDHIGVRVRNLDRALAFYRVLGFAVVRRAEGDDVAIIRNEHGVELNLVFNANAGDPATNILMDVRDKYPGYTHIALRVASIPQTVAALSENGIPSAQGPVSFGESGQRGTEGSNLPSSSRGSTNFRSLSDGRSTTNAVARSSSSRTGAARGRPRRPRSRSGAVGGPQLSGDRRSRRGARDRDDLGTAMLHSPSGRGLASGASRSPFAEHPSHDWRVQLCRPVSAILGPLGRWLGQGRMVRVPRQ